MAVPSDQYIAMLFVLLLFCSIFCNVLAIYTLTLKSNRKQYRIYQIAPFLIKLSYPNPQFEGLSPYNKLEGKYLVKASHGICQ